MSVDATKIEVPMPIRTPRLELRVPDPAYAVEMAEAIRESWEGLSRWMPWAVDLKEETSDKKVLSLQRAAEKFMAREDFTFLPVERERGRLIGSAGIHLLDPVIRSYRIGYWIRASEQEKGYATEISKGLLRYTFEALNARRIEIRYSEGNEASAAVVRKLDIHFEGIRRNDALLPGGLLADKYVYAAIPGDKLSEIDVSWG